MTDGFDLILAGGRVIDPAEGIDGPAEVAFKDGKVAAVGQALSRDGAPDVRDVAGAIVAPGLIDLHTHVYWGGTSIGVDPTDYARRCGTTTMIDAGTAGAGNFAGFRAHVIEPCDARILAYLNVSFGNIFSQPDMAFMRISRRISNMPNSFGNFNITRQNAKISITKDPVFGLCSLSHVIYFR